VAETPIDAIHGYPAEPVAMSFGNWRELERAWRCVRSKDSPLLTAALRKNYHPQKTRKNEKVLTSELQKTWSRLRRKDSSQKKHGEENKAIRRGYLGVYWLK